MTNRHANWERLTMVIKWANMTVNSFARHIGLVRAENLYHIKKGNYGISEDLADRIIAYFPQIDRTWLLSGIGNMLTTNSTESERLPFFSGDIADIMPVVGTLEAQGEIQLPYITGSHLVVRSTSQAMNETLSAATDLILREVGVHEVIQGNEYVLLFGDRVEWRRVRYVARDSNKWRLVARNRDEHADIFINRADVTRAWRVVARIAILES
ncbi:MAG: hypothetical protein IJB56_07170 [Alistipes sp.]|nr:hypothetical protein [Alistipes sp.]